MGKIMNNRTQETTTHSLRVQALLDKLRNKLNNFLVLDNKGLQIGMIKDVYLSNTRQINLLISATDLPDSQSFSLKSNQIQQVDYPNKLILANVDKSDVEPILASPQPQTIGEEVTDASWHEGYVNDEEFSNSSTTSVVEEEVIRLLEERLVINHHKRKVGEVIVRKEIETRMIQVPVHYEKLIIEQVSPESKIIAEIDLGQQEYSNTTDEIAANKTNANNTVKGEFISPKTASLLLDAIHRQKHDDCKVVRVEIVLENSENQATYQEWFDRCSGT